MSLFKKTILLVVHLMVISHVQAMDVTVSEVGQLAQGSNTQVVITLSEPAALRATLRKVAGEDGVALFSPDDVFELALTNSMTVTIRGVIPSSVPNNLMLEIFEDTNVIASTAFTVIDPELKTFNDATQIAYNAILGKVPVQEISSTEVVLYKNLHYLVTFHCIFPEDTAGPDFVAQVLVDGATGEILFAWQGI